MSNSPLNYDKMVQDALRGVVRASLMASRNGLPGYHHFYIGFDTRHPGVVIADYLKDQHPEEMTIVLQHQFWGLEVTDEWFEVTLSFNRVNERLHVPFAALTGFSDPSAKFVLQFKPDMTTGLLPPEAAKPVEEEVPAKPPRPEAGAQVVALDAFRKKQ